GRLVQPLGCCEREVAENGCVDSGQGHHRDSRLGGPAAGDLIALLAVPNVVENEGEPPLSWILNGQVAFGQRPVPADPITQLAIEGDLAHVCPEVDPDVPAVLIGGGELHHHALRVGPGPAVGGPIALAHLPGTDRLDAVQLQALYPEHGSEPFGRDAVSCLDYAG